MQCGALDLAAARLGIDADAGIRADDEVGDLTIPVSQSTSTSAPTQLGYPEQIARRERGVSVVIDLDAAPADEFGPGPAEIIQSSLREWAYARPFQTSAERGAAMLPWITSYNHSRPPSALGGKPPISRIARDNLLGNDS